MSKSQSEKIIDDIPDDIPETFSKYEKNELCSVVVISAESKEEAKIDKYFDSTSENHGARKVFREISTVPEEYSSTVNFPEHQYSRDSISALSRTITNT